MENNRISGGGGGDGGDGEIALPEEIIQQIQSFLNRKEAPRTSILSKSWYRAWISRPDLDFNEDDFPRHSDDFSAFTKKTLQRYEDSNLKIECFSLSMAPSEPKPEPHHHHHSLVQELIVRAIKLGATDLFTSLWNPSFHLPREVFESKTLVGLCASGCTFDLSEVTCSQIEVLDFFRQTVKGESIVQGRLQNSLDLSSKFPHLQELTIRNCYGCKDLRICSPSLERLRLDHSKILTAEFDVPNIQEFHFEGSASSSLTFTAVRGEWESDVHVTCDKTSESWFMSLNKLVTTLRGSKVSLCIRVECGSEERCDYSSHVQALPVPAVEKLELLDPTMLTRALAPNFLDGLFLSCRPKSIVLSWFPHSVWREQNYLLKFVCKGLVEEDCWNCCIPNRRMIGEHDLDEVNVEVLEESVEEWQSVVWKTLLDASACPMKKQKVRFMLKWGNA